MNKKKLLTGVAALGLVAAVGIGGSLAWFTDYESKKNEMKLGYVDISLDEDGTPLVDGIKEGLKNGDGLNYDQVLPGDKLAKTVIVTNDGAEAYIRLKITVTTENPNLINYFDTNKVDLEFYRSSNNLNDKYDLVFTGENGTYEAYLYSDKVFGEGYGLNDLAKSKYCFFEVVGVPYTWSNALANAEFDIDVTAEAIQAANVTVGESDDNIIQTIGEKVVAWNLGTSTIEKYPVTTVDTE